MVEWIAYFNIEPTESEWLRMQVAQNTATYINSKMSANSTKHVSYSDVLLAPAKPKTEEELKAEAEAIEMAWSLKIQILKKANGQEDV